MTIPLPLALTCRGNPPWLPWRPAHAGIEQGRRRGLPLWEGVAAEAIMSQFAIKGVAKVIPDITRHGPE